MDGCRSLRIGQIRPHHVHVGDCAAADTRTGMRPRLCRVIALSSRALAVGGERTNPWWMTTAADLLLETIIDWRVDTVFGLPGDGINGIMEALRQRQDRVRFVQVRHEEAAALMAVGYAKVTGKLGVCLATGGPGGLHLLNGLYDAKLDGQPVLAITGMPFHDLIGTHVQQDVPLDRVFADVAVFNERIMGPAHVENVADLACRTALARRGVAHIAFPADLQTTTLEQDKRSLRNVPGHTSDVPASGVRLPESESIVRAAGILNRGSRTMIMAGQGALHASVALERVAEVLGAPIGKALLGKAAVPDDSPYVTGPVGFLGSEPSMTALEECDTLLLVGTSMPYLEFYPKAGQARAVQIDADPARIGLRYPAEVGLVGDSRLTLEALLPHLEQRADRSFLNRAQEGMRHWRGKLEQEAARTSKPCKPQRVARALANALPDNAIVCADSGTSTVWWARHVPVRRGQQHVVSGTLATMGCGLTYAIAAQIAHPGRPCVALVGDGGFSMVMAELLTCVRHRLPVKIVILNNQSLAYIRWEQMLYQGNPEFGVQLQDMDFAAFARSCGAQGVRLEDPLDCDRIMQEALSSTGPFVVDARVDPLEPPTPPKITREEAIKFEEALAKGQPHRDEIAKTSLGHKVREMV
jgi:pyruvate dehydrogenase (quinone)